jgi:hypothetical protein
MTGYDVSTRSMTGLGAVGFLRKKESIPFD